MEAQMDKNICIELRIVGRRIEIVDGDNGRYVVSKNNLSNQYVTTQIDNEVVTMLSDIPFEKHEEIITKFLRDFAEIVGEKAQGLIDKEIIDRLCFAYKMSEPIAISAFFTKNNIQNPDFATRRTFEDANGLFATFMAGKAPKATTSMPDYTEEKLGENGSIEEVEKLLKLKDENLMKNSQYLVDYLVGDVERSANI